MHVAHIIHLYKHSYRQTENNFPNRLLCSRELPHFWTASAFSFHFWNRGKAVIFFLFWQKGITLHSLNRRAERCNLGHYSKISTGQLHLTARWTQDAQDTNNSTANIPCSNARVPQVRLTDSFCSVSHGPGFGWDTLNFLLRMWYCAVLWASLHYCCSHWCSTFVQ